VSKCNCSSQNPYSLSEFETGTSGFVVCDYESLDFRPLEQPAIKLAQTSNANVIRVVLLNANSYLAPWKQNIWRLFTQLGFGQSQKFQTVYKVNVRYSLRAFNKFVPLYHPCFNPRYKTSSANFVNDHGPFYYNKTAEVLE
jgi:hypothetical protein